ncbi:hypothetical protein HIM_05627 [Hirsutella minnesotensis 3608]|uniref:DUF7580 domain-containing protein n=1 Tax=Hirsutella minnesotensis 3608 TaxID=1043627 RepID=A0A0F7ZKD0_9HYPO|nr:hypothetical protein HIM_05627 [Hirsutella minnesotensis 3608]
MDFFEADLASKRIYFLDSPKTGFQKESPYLAFGVSRRLMDARPSHFRLGHPGLMAFAKLLLEIEFGQNIDLYISPDSSQNEIAWAQLLGRVELLAEERSDSYLRAIRGCLLVHYQIALALRSSEPVGKGSDLTIRKTLYKEVVYYLELGLSESTPRALHKRERSE